HHAWRPGAYLAQRVRGAQGQRRPAEHDQHGAGRTAYQRRDRCDHPQVRTGAWHLPAGGPDLPALVTANHRSATPSLYVPIDAFWSAFMSFNAFFSASSVSMSSASGLGAAGCLACCAGAGVAATGWGCAFSIGASAAADDAGVAAAAPVSSAAFCTGPGNSG